MHSFSASNPSGVLGLSHPGNQTLPIISFPSSGSFPFASKYIEAFPIFKKGTQKTVQLHSLLGTTVFLLLAVKIPTNFSAFTFSLPICCSTHYKFPRHHSIQPVLVTVGNSLLVTKSMETFQNLAFLISLQDYTLLTILSFLNVLFPWLPKHFIVNFPLLLWPLDLSFFGGSSPSRYS